MDERLWSVAVCRDLRHIHRKHRGAGMIGALGLGSFHRPLRGADVPPMISPVFVWHLG